MLVITIIFVLVVRVDHKQTKLHHKFLMLTKEELENMKKEYLQ